MCQQVQVEVIIALWIWSTFGDGEGRQVVWHRAGEGGRDSEFLTGKRLSWRLTEPEVEKTQKIS